MKISLRLTKLASKKTSKDITLGHLLNKFKKKDNFFLIILLAIPVATPLSYIPGFSAFFGLSIALISSQLLMGRKKIWLPEKLKNKKIHSNIMDGILKIIPYIKLVEKYIKKRAAFFTSHFLRYFFIVIILILSILLILPTPYVDFISSSSIILLSVGIIKRDGFLVLIAFSLCLVYLSFVFYLLRFVLSVGYELYKYI